MTVVEPTSQQVWEGVASPTARILSTERKVLESAYPKYLELKQLIVVHRHGERTPLAPRFPGLLPLRWNYCGLGNKKTTLLPETSEFYSKETKGSFINFPYTKVAESEDVCLYNYSDLPIPRAISDASTCIYGQLTDPGRNTLTRNGRNLREIYTDYLKFLPKSATEWKPEDIYLRTTDYPRTLESLQHLLLGLFPNESEKSRPDFKIHSRDHKNENLYLDFNCKRLAELRSQLTKSFRTALVEEWQELRKDLIATTELSTILKTSEFDSPSGIHKLVDSFMCARAHNIQLPKGITSDHLNKLESYQVDLWFNYFKKSPELIRLGIGRFYLDITNHLKASVSDSKAAKLAIYSGHDTTLGPLLIGLGVFDNHWPSFGSMAHFELFHDSHPPSVNPTSTPTTTSRDSLTKTYQSYYVRVRYNDQFKVMPYCQPAGRHHPQAGPAFCRLDHFLDLVREYSPVDYVQECQGYKDEISDR